MICYHLPRSFAHTISRFIATLVALTVCSFAATAQDVLPDIATATTDSIETIVCTEPADNIEPVVAVNDTIADDAVVEADGSAPADDAVVEAADSAPANDEEHATAPLLLKLDNDYSTPMPIEVKPKGYRFIDEFSWAGIPLIAAGLIARTDRKNFRQVRHKFEYNFHNRLDDYIQYSPLALTFVLKAFGGGRGNWGRYMTSAAFSSGLMALLVNVGKYSLKEMRPDGSTRNSFPSGHTATAFMAATILHKEYGMTRSPWYSVGGYAVATTTGIMRVLNNRHWVSDVLAGAGIGILSTELGYALADLIFKDKGIWQYDRFSDVDLTKRTSFFGIQMGIGLGTRDITFAANEFIDEPVNFKFQSSTVVGVEGAFFINKYFGLGGRFRIKSTPVKGWSGLFTDAGEAVNEFTSDPDIKPIVDQMSLEIESDHLAEYSTDLGFYFNLPINKRFALGSKLLFGGNFVKSVEIDGHASGHQLRANPNPTDEDDTLLPTDIPFNSKWDFLDLKGNNTFKWGTGLSIAFTHKGYIWRVFCDYDYSRKTYTLNYNPIGFIYDVAPGVFNDIKSSDLISSATLKKTMHSFVIGGSFNIAF